MISLNVWSQNSLSVSNIITLKEAGLSDAVIIEMIKNQPRLITIQRPPVRQIDIESYDFYWNNYLYPRTLRYRYQMLSPYRR